MFWKGVCFAVCLVVLWTYSNDVTPLDNQLLGELFFHSKALSYNGDISCASCHRADLAFTDGYRKSFNAYGEALRTNAPTLLNISDNSYFHSSDTSVNSIATQLHVPFFGEDPREMEYFMDSNAIKKNLLQEKKVANAFYVKYPNQGLNMHIIKNELVQFIHSLKGRNASYDNVNCDAKNERYRKGEYLFFSKYQCSRCHGGVDFDQASAGADTHYDVLGNGIDIKIPTLRNISITGPYFSTGEYVTLQGAIQAHSDILNIPNVSMPDDEMREIIYFLNALTDSIYIKQ